MIIRVNLLIYLYIIFCGCILVFDFFYALRKRWRRNSEPKEVRKYRWTLVLLLSRDDFTLQEKELRQWVSAFSRISRLLYLHEAVDSLLKDEVYQSSMKRWLQSNKDLFMMLGNRYIKKSETFYATFFAYQVWQYHLCTEKDTDRLVVMMHQLCLRPSLYCRENALCALYVCGCSAHVVKAYMLLSQHGVEHSAKLVTDGLLQFSGNKDELAEQLWDNWNAFPAYYRVCFINYIRMVSANFCERFYAMLVQGNANNEVLFAIIRYFRTHRYAPVEPLLQELVIQWETRDWEFAAIAALSLEKYPSPKTEQALLIGCHSASWHVRENASDSLMQMVEISTIESLNLQEKDRYAREMLQYKLAKKEEQQKKKEESANNQLKMSG